MAIYDVDGAVLCEGLPTQYPDADCMTAFLAYMAEKCTAFGMSGTHYANPSGLTTDSYSTPQDEMKLGIAVAASPKALDIWSVKDRSFAIKGDHARTVEIVSNGNNGLGAYLAENGYKRLGGKGGSLQIDGYHKAGIQLVIIEGTPYILGIMGTTQTVYNNFDAAIKELCDVLKATAQGQTPVVGSNLAQLVSSGGGYAACPVPVIPGAYENLMAPADMLAAANAVSSSPTASRIPASTTKAMTMLCALDWVTEPHMLLTVKAVDIVGGSGSTFYAGDELAFWDAVRIMMMESSNTMAHAIARTVGNIILNRS